MGLGWALIVASWGRTVDRLQRGGESHAGGLEDLAGGAGSLRAQPEALAVLGDLDALDPVQIPDHLAPLEVVVTAAGGDRVTTLSWDSRCHRERSSEGIVNLTRRLAEFADR